MRTAVAGLLLIPLCLAAAAADPTPKELVGVWRWPAAGGYGGKPYVILTEFRANGTTQAQFAGPGAPVPNEQAGTWRLDGNKLTMQAEIGGDLKPRPDVVTVAEFTGKRMVLVSGKLKTPAVRVK